MNYCIHSQKLIPFVSFSTLYSLARQAFDVNYGLFMVTEDQLLYPNSSKYARESEYHLLRSVLKRDIADEKIRTQLLSSHTLSSWALSLEKHSMKVSL